ncbi:MAG: MGMT family protein [Candidatus Azambacteria bacterium]|nr:MGMT family protein [Candidatus Azambacteria bacterium]
MNNFANEVLKAVRRIPKGKTRTYKEIAAAAGRPRAWRAVGNILNKNFNPKIPCYRVIRSDGKIGGYNRGMNKKIFLLKKEKALS